MEQFIKKHRKLAMAVLIGAVILVGILLFINRTNAGTTSRQAEQTADEAIEGGDNDVSESIQYKTPLYTLAGNPEKPEEITIDAYPGYRNAATNVIYQLGLSPTDYKITYTYESPFKRYE